MLEAPTINDVLKHIKREGNPLCCILFAPVFDKFASDQIVPRIGYLDYRTSENIHFYLPGYYGYGYEGTYYPDGQPLGEVRHEGGAVIPWYFSQRKFAEFIDDMERQTSWRYSGGSELIILNEKADFSNAIIFKVDNMLRDKMIMNLNSLFEALIQHSRSSSNTIEHFSLNGIGKNAGQAFVNGIMESLPKGLKSLSDIWIKGRHYALESIA